MRNPGTPAERLLYSLGQLYRRWYRDELPVDPHDFDVVELATTIGVHLDIEMVTNDPSGAVYRFAGEVLVSDPDAQFPWRLLTVAEWSLWAELSDLDHPSTAAAE